MQLFSPKSKRFWLLTLLLISMPTAALAQDETGTRGFLGALEAGFQKVVDVLNAVFFYRIGGENGMPIIVLWLISGALFFTFRMGFINIRAFKHAIEVVRGKYDDPEDEGDVSHFQALAAALSGTVGVGNMSFPNLLGCFLLSGIIASDLKEYMARLSSG